jgi:hypothetical protein
LSVGAYTGRIVTVDLNGVVQGTRYTLPEHSPDEADALSSVLDDWFTRDDLLALGYPQGKVQRLVASLQGKRLLTSERIERKLAYKVTALIPIPNDFRSVTEAFATEPLEEEPVLTQGRDT